MSATQQSSETTHANGSTRLVMLGTGTPRPDPNCAGPATVVVANNAPYLIDFGAGVVRRAMTENVLKAWQIDIAARSNGPHRKAPAGCKVNVHEIVPGIVYKDAYVTVTAFPVRHEDMVNSFGFRFETPDRTIVISGDTIPTQALIDHSRGCDILIHEAYSMATFREVAPHWQEYRQRAHTSTVELAEIASTVKPGLLVIYHRSNAGGAPGTVDIEEVLIKEIRQMYKGNVVAAHDLDVF